jgi:hypothetical protein
MGMHMTYNWIELVSGVVSDLEVVDGEEDFIVSPGQERPAIVPPSCWRPQVWLVLRLLRFSRRALNDLRSHGRSFSNSEPTVKR